MIAPGKISGRAMWQTDYWQTASGERYSILEMETSHLFNVLRYLDRKIQEPTFKLSCVMGMPRMWSEGDMAQLSIEREEDDYFDAIDQGDASVLPLYRAIQAELTTRSTPHVAPRSHHRRTLVPR